VSGNGADDCRVLDQEYDPAALSVCASRSAIAAQSWFPGISGAGGPRHLGRGHAATWLSAVRNSSTRARWSKRLRQLTEPFPVCAARCVRATSRIHGRHSPSLGILWATVAGGLRGVPPLRCLMRLAVRQRRHSVLPGDSALPARVLLRARKTGGAPRTRGTDRATSVSASPASSLGRPSPRAGRTL